MFSELDTDAFLAYAKAHHRDLVQQAAMDALRRRTALQQQGKAPRPRHRLALLHSLRHVLARCASARLYALAEVGPGRKDMGERAPRAPAQNEQRLRACRAVE